jgi:hypothetical protein
MGEDNSEFSDAVKQERDRPPNKVSDRAERATPTSQALTLVIDY